MVVQFYYAASEVDAATKKAKKSLRGVPVVTVGPGSAGRSGGGAGEGGVRSGVCPAVEEHIFDVSGRIKVFFVLGDAF
jgi:hypothetical protein